VIVSELISKIKPSSTLAVAAKAAKMVSEGKDVISLSAGEPDFDTPSNIKNAAIKAIERGQTKYTAVDGTKELKEAVKNKFKQENQLEYNLDQITIGSGAKQVIFNALIAILNPGDEVILPAPYWVSYPEMVTFCRGAPVIVDCDKNNGFKLKPEQLERSITRKTKLLILNSPSNPTGAVYSKEELIKIGDILIRNPGIFVICDDIYEHMTFADFGFNTLAQVYPDLYNRVLTVNGVSKSYSMTGWRIGYGGGSKEWIKAIATVQSQSTSNPCSISQAAAVEALTGPQNFITESYRIFKKRSELIYNSLLKIDNVTCNKPEGAFYVFPDFSAFFGKKTPNGKIINSSIDIADYLLEDALVAVVPGSPFGSKDYIRLSYATSEEKIESALSRIKIACKNLS
jgi:aspartate aminotransferase